MDGADQDRTASSYLTLIDVQFISKSHDFLILRRGILLTRKQAIPLFERVLIE
jgi:hypothetical protein